MDERKPTQAEILTFCTSAAAADTPPLLVVYCTPSNDQTQRSWRLFPNIDAALLFLQRGYRCGIAIPENENTDVKFGYIVFTSRMGMVSRHTYDHQ